MKTNLPAFIIATLLSAISCVSLAAQPNYQKAKLQQILQSGELKVCIWPDYYGITFKNPKTKTLTGIDIDISIELEKDLGVKIRYIDSSFPELIDNLLKNKCDIAMHAVGITPARLAQLEFSQPYLRSDIYAIKSKANDTIQSWDDIDKPGRIVAAQDGTLMVSIMQKTLKQAKLLVVAPPLTREQEVESGRADVFMTDFPYSRRMLETTDWARMISPIKPFHMTDYAYAIAPGDPAFLARINSFIDKIKRDGRLHSIASKHKLDPIVVTN
ncbi:substrate-binding periplasmic protein [Undibacterium sp. Dicai25W]|uniref:substrate-binding periplasmic protein n=1 Tax=Undibacterium sp. Dicai25W TaxID=3413034 RepID=UPI003BF022FD